MSQRIFTRTPMYVTLSPTPPFGASRVPKKPSHGFGRDDRLACRCRGTVAEASRGRGGTVAAAGTAAGTRLRYRVRRLAKLRTPLRCPSATHEDRDPGSAHADSTSVGLDQEQPSATAPWQEPLSRPRPWSRNRPPHLARVGTPWSLGRSRNHGPSSSSRASHPICCHRGFAARAPPHVPHVALLFRRFLFFFLPAPVPPALSSSSSLR